MVDWITQASNDLRHVSESLASISRQLHEFTRKWGDAVESPPLASEASDPRVQLLNKALHVSSRADLELSRIGAKLTSVTKDWPNQFGQSSQIEEGSQEKSTSSSDGDITIRKDIPASSDIPFAYEREGLANSILQQERNEPGTWYEIARELNSTLEFNAVLQRVMDLVIRFVHAERGFLMLRNPATKEPEFTIARDEFSQPIAEFSTISLQTVRDVIRTREPLLTNDAQADPTKSILANDIRSIMCAPLLVRGQCIGVVYVDRRFTKTLFELRHRELLLAFCNQAAIAIHNASLFDDLNKTMKQVREDKQYMDNIFSSIVNGVITTNSTGMITTFNDAASYILLLRSQQVMGQHYTEAFKLLPQVGLIPLLNRTHSQPEHDTTISVECTIPGRGLVNLNCYVSALRDTQGAHIGMALVIDDQTSIKKSREQAKKVRRLFEQYVHPKVVEQLIQNPQALKLGGETKEISVIFADIRGYTRLGESMPPDKVMDLINGYLQIMCDAIWEEEGTLTAFQGDALMAIFNAPLPQKMHALHAVRAAWKMHTAVLEYQRSLPKELQVSFGFGVNTGLATVGNVGAKGRLQNYTAIGDVINVASRLQSNATNNDIYVSDSTYTQVGGYAQFSRPFSLKVKNKAAPLTVYRLLGPA